MVKATIYMNGEEKKIEACPLVIAVGIATEEKGANVQAAVMGNEAINPDAAVIALGKVMVGVVSQMFPDDMKAVKALACFSSTVREEAMSISKKRLMKMMEEA